MQVAAAQLNASLPQTVAKGLAYAAKHDIFELRGPILAIARDEGAFEELRCVALSLAAGWNTPGWRDLAASWMFRENPVYRWEAMTLIFDDLALRERVETPNWALPDIRRLAEQARKLGRENGTEQLLARALVALTVRTAGVRADQSDALENWRELLKNPYLAAESKRRIVLAYLDEIQGLSKYLPLFSSDRERRDFLTALWRSGRRQAWLEVVRTLLPDRYLNEPIKHDILTHVIADFPADVQQEAALYLLAPWDPGFHQEARSRFGEVLGVELVERLQAANQSLTDGNELLASGHAQGALEAFQETLQYLEGLLVSRSVALRLVEALMLSGRNEEADRTLAEMGTLNSNYGSRALERRIRVLRSYGPAQGYLPEDLNIRVTGIQVEPAARRFVFGRERFSMVVELSNSSPRALPGGDWDLGGRYRVLWSRDGRGEWSYGTQVSLPQGILPGQVRRDVIEVEAPEEPGEWVGRIIVSQQGGARFHLVEGHSSMFNLTVVRKGHGPPDKTWLPVEMWKHFDFDQDLREPMILDPETQPELKMMARGYEDDFRLPSLIFWGQEKQLELVFDWFSTIDKAMLLRVDLLPWGSYPAVNPVIRNITWKGGEQVIKLRLPTCAGLYRLEVRIGYRQGDLKLRSIHVE